jgi:hypothetical protein
VEDKAMYNYGYTSGMNGIGNNYSGLTQQMPVGYNSGAIGQVGMNNGMIGTGVRADFNGILVNDFEEVKQYPVPIGGLTLLLNKRDKKFYLKQLNDNGVPIIETYNFEVATSSKETDKTVDINELSKRVDILEKKINSKKNNEQSEEIVDF